MGVQAEEGANSELAKRARGNLVRFGRKLIEEMERNGNNCLSIASSSTITKKEDGVESDLAINNDGRQEKKIVSMAIFKQKYSDFLKKNDDVCTGGVKNNTV